jgi:hypothetical protein
MTTIDEAETEWPAEVGDPVREAVGQLLVAIIENTVAGPERARAMGEALQAHERIKQALAPLPRLN